MGQNTARGVRFLLGFNVYLFLAQFEQVYLFLVLALLFLSEVYDLFQLLCVLLSVFICFPPEVIFRYRVIGACSVTTDCIVSMS